MSDRLFNYRDNTRFESKHPQFENQTNIMNNIVETSSGEIVEIINGVLVCQNVKRNWITISEWFLTESESWDLKCEIRVEDTNLFVEFPESVPTHKIGSLLESFNYQ